MDSIGYGGKGKKSLVDRITEGDFVRDKELERGLKVTMGSKSVGAGKVAKKIGAKMNLGFAKHL